MPVKNSGTFPGQISWPTVRRLAQAAVRRSSELGGSAGSDMLAGLVARDGARRVLLGVLPPDDAVALLRALIGPRVDAESEG
jgi:hypothetical protein